MAEDYTVQLVGEVRAEDTGKLLFCIAEDGDDYLLLIKPRGTHIVYNIPLKEIVLFLQDLE